MNTREFGIVTSVMGNIATGEDFDMGDGEFRTPKLQEEFLLAPADVVSSGSYKFKYLEQLTSIELYIACKVISKRVGSGSFGEVFKGSLFGEPVTIKTLLDISRANVQSFRAEILLTSTLRHPNVSRQEPCVP